MFDTLEKKENYFAFECILKHFTHTHIFITTTKNPYKKCRIKDYTELVLFFKKYTLLDLN